MERTAIFGAGCFWGVEAAFRRIDGVLKTRVGYAGGDVEHPSYEQVCYSDTGHAEVVEVTYDDEKVPYERLLAIVLGRARSDPGRPAGAGRRQAVPLVIFVDGDDQRAAAEASRAQVQARLSRPVATSIEDAPPFWEAEDYHQQYLEKRGLASCTARLATA